MIYLLVLLAVIGCMALLDWRHRTSMAPVINARYLFNEYLPTGTPVLGTKVAVSPMSGC